jgi:hypothetical protein
VFTIVGRLWPPGQPVTMSLLGVATAPKQLLIDRAGNFTVVLNGRHSFFRGQFTKVGAYQVSFVAPGGARRIAVVHVYHA